MNKELEKQFEVRKIFMQSKIPPMSELVEYADVVEHHNEICEQLVMEMIKNGK